MQQDDWRLPEGALIWDRSQQTAPPDVLYPFALEELLCRSVGEGGPPIVHLWRHPRAFVMGLRDSRLPGAVEAKRWLERQGYSVAVRNSGGAAVPLDTGVVNVSLVLPKRQGQIDFRQDFETMYMLVKDALQAVTPDVAKGEVIGSYCPGDYDLSIAGRKFCGIAQRRQAHAFVVQAFVVVTGSGAAKAELAREFYRIAAAGEDGSSYPDVHEDRMASLQELAGLDDPQRFIDAVKRTVRARTAPAEEGARTLRLPGDSEISDMIASLKQRYGIGEPTP
ncbi:lipoate--protein ligase family protein [Paenibacillus doosanensis]|uniref:Lipoyl-[GcvH]:protein N-lipoyltransferase n=1 Tax=Paenibacillus konkukensis TaxID=2020716 RepID=A0ABY4RKI2_9BACL|nr:MULTISPECIES: lipoate--protein ligase family protein [Paenibacillus]MCS7462659.1 lipoate--protein ligase family protein [Paenibacillus doosanensis]UQZ82520.1 Lipoyl-[GcvH]:protein N-lipoyltransferase [Paenibacillus konkukensis]